MKAAKTYNLQLITYDLQLITVIKKGNAMIDSIVKKWCDENDLPIIDSKLEQFEAYAKLLKEWNEKMNLTAITDDEGIAVKHFIDSLSLCKYVQFDKAVSVIDIGTGAGFPGIPLKIMFPEIDITLLDSLNKRLIFLQDVCDRLGLKCLLVHGRAEELGRNELYREKYDIAVSRAVANLPALCEYCIPFVKVGGRFVSMKGPDGENELASSEKAFNILGGNVENIFRTELPDNSRRTIISVKKISRTPPKYPRRGVKINKSPL